MFLNICCFKNMNNISKYLHLFRKISFLTSSILKKQHVIQDHAFLTSIKTRYSSNTNQIDLMNTVDTNDTLITNIKLAQQTKEVLEMLRIHNSIMTYQQHLQALNSLFMLQKNDRTKLSKEELTRSPEFTALCHKITIYSRNLDLNDVLNSVKCLSYLGVSVNSNIMQVLLQLISKMINEMSLQQITFLHFLLKELSSCPLVDALALALPIVFETQVQYKIEDNVYWQVKFLNYVAKHNLSQESFDFVMSRIIKNIDQLNPKIVKSLLLCLYYKGYSTDKYIDVINKCIQIFINHLELIANTSDIEVILTRMLYKYVRESECFYNEHFINVMLEYLIEKQESFENVSYIVKKLNKIGYVHRGLLDYMTCQLASEHETLEKCKFGVLLSYIIACANANYKPPNFIELKPDILKRFSVQKATLELPWLLLTFNLAILECWSQILLECAFSKTFLNGFSNRSDNINDYTMLLKLYQAVVTLYPGGYEGTLPSTDILEKATNIYQNNFNDFPLKSALEQGLGGSDYVLTGVKSKFGHFIDHVIVMRPGGYPVAIQNESINDDKSKLILENVIKSYKNNLVIAILVYHPNDYVINLNCLKGEYALNNKMIETIGAVLFPISLEVWDGLMDYEKIPYIMRELKSKADINLTTDTIGLP